MDMSSMSDPHSSATSTSSSTHSTAMAGDNTPGQINANGKYVPTSDEMMAFQAARISWADEVKFGYYTLYFLASLVLLFALLNVFWKVRLRSRKVSLPLYTKLAAMCRLMTYPQLPVNRYLTWLWTFGSLGPNIILGAGLVFATCFTWINEYYYYPPYYGSAPLYLRSEWIAMATLPFVYVLGSKRNVISVLTGISHEKLQVLHQGAAFNFTYMSLVHTIAACIRAIREDGVAYATVNNVVYMSGFVALAPLLVLFAGALPPFRRSFYEAFYWVHIIMALFFAGALFWHGYKLLDSDAYMIATIVLFLSGATWRVTMIVLDNPILHVARATLLDGETLKLTVPTLYIKWGPGQHVFIRFMSIRPFESHPFSFASIPHLPDAGTVEMGYTKVEKKGFQEMVFLIKPLSGFTKALFDDVKSKYQAPQREAGKNRQPTVQYRVLVDGPYGGVGRDLRAFDSVLIVVGGTGITWALSVLQDLAYYGKGQEVKFVWAVRRKEALSWFADELAAIRASHPTISVQVHITDEDLSSFPHIERSSNEAEVPAGQVTPMSEDNMKLETSSPVPVPVVHGRPNLSTLIEAEVTCTHGSLAVACCGPASMLVDTSNAVTKAQIGILKGAYPDVTEVFLKSESYGW